MVQLYYYTLPGAHLCGCCAGELMVTWGCLTADEFIREVTEFVVNNPYEEEGVVSGIVIYKQMLSLSLQSFLA